MLLLTLAVFCFTFFMCSAFQKFVTGFDAFVVCSLYQSKVCLSMFCRPLALFHVYNFLLHNTILIRQASKCLLYCICTTFASTRISRILYTYSLLSIYIHLNSANDQILKFLYPRLKLLDFFPRLGVLSLLEGQYLCTI